MRMILTWGVLNHTTNKGYLAAFLACLAAFFSRSRM
jgi:hypothetical protein